MTLDQIIKAFAAQTAQEPPPTKLYALVRHPTRMALHGLPNDPEAILERMKGHTLSDYRVGDHIPWFEAPR